MSSKHGRHRADNRRTKRSGVPRWRLALSSAAVVTAAVTGAAIAFEGPGAPGSADMGSTRAASDTTRSSVADARSTAPTTWRHSTWDRPGAEKWREWREKKRKKQHRAGEKSKPIEWRHKGERHRQDKRGPSRAPDTGSPAPTTAPPAPSQPAPSTPSGGSGNTSGGSANSSVVQQVVALVNKERAAAGCSPVTVNDALTRAAQKHSDAMAASGRLSHTGADGSTMASRVEAEGYDWSTLGENIAQGQRTPEEVMADWMSSPGHRENILNCSFKEIGVGVNMGSGGPWWTQDFGTRP